MDSSLVLSRRSLLLAGAGAALTMAAAQWGARAAGVREIRLVAAAGQASLVGESHPQTEVLGYDGKVPGPTLHLRQGEPVRIIVENKLDQDTTVHWHGIRLPNA